MNVEAAPFQRLAQLAGVVGGEQHGGLVLGLDRAELGHGDLELAQNLQQESLELGVGAVDLVDQEHHGLVAGERLEQRAGQQEALGEEDILLAGQPVGGLAQAFGVAQHIAELVAQQLRIEQLLGVLPLVERLRLVQALVALQADKLAAGGAGPALGQLGLTDAGGALGEQGLAQPLGQEQSRGDLIGGDVLLGAQHVAHVADRVQHARKYLSVRVVGVPGGRWYGLTARHR